MTAIRHVEHLLVGAGVASAHCAATLRREGADGAILMVGRELDLPYERPPCSKSYLRGESTREDALVRPADWYAAHEIEVLTRVSAMKLDVAERVVKLSNREEVSFDRALIATGANVRRLNVPGSELTGIHYLRAFGNSDAIREDLAAGGFAGKRVVLIGGSYIASEVAASLTMLGCQCTMMMLEPVALSTRFGEDVGRFFDSLLRERGVVVQGAQSLARFEGDAGRVQRVVAESGLVIECDAVVLGTGVSPDVMLARAAGLELADSGGVKVDEHLESSAAGVFAAGDVATWPYPFDDGRLVRIEHLDGAMAGGRTVAQNMLGRRRRYVEVPYFWSDLGDWLTLEYVGAAAAWDTEVLRGSLDDAEFSLWYVRGGRVVAALSVGRPEELAVARRVIAGGGELAAAGVERLGDAGFDLSLL